MDDSIQTLKDEMNKLMSVYEYVKVVILRAFDYSQCVKFPDYIFAS